MLLYWIPKYVYERKPQQKQYLMAWLVRGSEVLASIEIADTAATRSKGLMKRDSIDGAILLKPAKSVHTFGVRFPIDVAYCIAVEQDPAKGVKKPASPPGRQTQRTQTEHTQTQAGEATPVHNPQDAVWSISSTKPSLKEPLTKPATPALKGEQNQVASGVQNNSDNTPTTANVINNEMVYQVIDIAHMKPKRLGKPRLRAHVVIEAQTPAFERWSLKCGDILRIRKTEQ